MIPNQPVRKAMIASAWSVVLAVLALSLCFAGDVNGLRSSHSQITPVYGYQVINRYAHDTNAFTQGLLFHDGYLYESTGIYGESTLRQVDLRTGNILRLVKLPDRVFGEGLTVWKENLIQLTWRAGIAFVFERETLNYVNQFPYATEGWGLTHDGRHLIMSDGSAQLFFRDPETFDLVRTLSVADQGRPVNNLNELEFVRGEIYANVWMSNSIARIAPDTGEVMAWVDLTGLHQLTPGTPISPDNVLNGIAYDEKNDRLYVTGKRWSTLYEISIVPQLH